MWHSAHGAVVILRAYITAFPAPVDLEEATAADLTQSLMNGLVHTCSKPDITFIDIRILHISALLTCESPGRHGVQSLAAVCRASFPPGHVWHWAQPVELPERENTGLLV